MNLFRRRTDLPAEHHFGPWLVGKLADGSCLADMRLAELEQLCSNAAAVLCGAAFAEPETARALFHDNDDAREDAELVAERVGEALDAPLEDRDPTALSLSWPWDRIGVRAAVRVQDSATLEEHEVGQWLMEVCGAYAAYHRDQLGSALNLWEQIATRAQPEAEADSRPSLVTMGRQLLGAFQLLQLSEGMAPGDEREA